MVRTLIMRRVRGISLGGDSAQNVALVPRSMKMKKAAVEVKKKR